MAFEDADVDFPTSASDARVLYRTDVVRDWLIRSPPQPPRAPRFPASDKLLIIDELGYVPLSQTGAEAVRGLRPALRAGATIVTRICRSMNRPACSTLGLDRRLARSPDPSRPHSRNERRELSAGAEGASLQASRPDCVARSTLRDGPSGTAFPRQSHSLKDPPRQARASPRDENGQLVRALRRRAPRLPARRCAACELDHWTRQSSPAVPCRQ